MQEETAGALVAALQGIGIAHAAARVGDCLHARLAGQLYRVVPGEGEEGVAGQHGTLYTRGSLPRVSL